MVERVKRNKLMEKKWYNGAVIACIGVAFYVLLTNLGTVLSAVGGFLANFKAVFIGAVFAYVINPLAKFFYYRVFRKMRLGNGRWVLSVALAFLTGLLALVLLIGTLIPQLVQSGKLRGLFRNADPADRRQPAGVDDQRRAAPHAVGERPELHPGLRV